MHATGTSTSRVFHDVLTEHEIQDILNFYQDKDDANTEVGIVNKNLEYHIPDNFIYKLLEPKITTLIGPHEFATGAYKECSRPYPLHVDTYEAHKDLTTVTNFSETKNHNMAMLIPLVEGNKYQTVTFKCFSKKNNFYPMPPEWLGERNSLQQEEFTHMKQGFDHMARLPIDVAYRWKLGDILTWDRDQLHVSADFAKHGLIKKFLILFIA